MGDPPVGGACRIGLQPGQAQAVHEPRPVHGPVRPFRRRRPRPRHPAAPSVRRPPGAPAAAPPRRRAIRRSAAAVPRCSSVRTASSSPRSAWPRSFSVRTQPSCPAAAPDPASPARGKWSPAAIRAAAGARCRGFFETRPAPIPDHCRPRRSTRPRKRRCRHCRGNVSCTYRSASHGSLLGPAPNEVFVDQCLRRLVLDARNRLQRLGNTPAFDPASTPSASVVELTPCAPPRRIRAAAPMASACAEAAAGGPVGGHGQLAGTRRRRTSSRCDDR